MRRRDDPSLLKTTLLWIGIAVAIALAPPDWTRRTTQAVRDAARPTGWVASNIRNLCDATAEHWRSHQTQHAELRKLRDKLRQRERTLRQLEVRNSLLAEQVAELSREARAPYRGVAGEPLWIPELLNAGVIGREQRAAVERSLVVGVGRSDGIQDAQIVLDDTRPLIDQGTGTQVNVGQPVYSGSIVVGRVASAGKFVSTVQLVTDPTYRGRAQLARDSQRGPVFGAEGILEGCGEEWCLLRSIPATEAVAVGDRVYTGGRSSLLPYPMYYGTVSHAVLEPGADEWTIQVQPAADFGRVKSVQILRDSLNRVRVLGQ